MEEAEFNEFRSAVYEVSWVAKESRPEVSGTASILAQRMTDAKVKDIHVLNKDRIKYTHMFANMHTDITYAHTHAHTLARALSYAVTYHTCTRHEW